ncbi:hypothetical protein V2J09_000804 [Rumex salicifolius]
MITSACKITKDLCKGGLMVGRVLLHELEEFVGAKGDIGARYSVVDGKGVLLPHSKATNAERGVETSSRPSPSYYVDRRRSLSCLTWPLEALANVQCTRPQMLSVYFVCFTKEAQRWTRC